MKMTMTADEAKGFMRELHERWSEPHNGMHADYIGFIEGESYRAFRTVGATTYRCVHRTACYATFEAVDPWTGETVRFRRRIRVCGAGEPTAWIGYSEDCKSPFGERAGLTEYICSSDIAY